MKEIEIKNLEERFEPAAAASLATAKLADNITISC